MNRKIYAALVAACLALASHPASAQSSQAAPLRAKFASLAESLRNNQYKRPLYIESAEASGTLKGDVYAVVDHSFPAVNAALSGPSPWCDIMIMPINTKECRVTERPAGTMLTVRIGRKSDQPVKDAYPIDFAFRVAESSADYIAVRLDAETGPLGTHDYRVLLEATPADNGKTFLHLRYSYGYGAAGRIAMQAYLATAGAGKVGFTSSGNELIGGMRGVVERNTMRYYLAVDAYLDAAATPANERVERRLAAWFDATEQYKRQLHELDRDAYLAMKRREVQRQQTAQEAVSGPRTSGSL
jgi:hypothetical protein